MNAADHASPAGWRRWVYTTDHRDIGALYLWTAVIFFVLAGAAALLFRVELLDPDMTLMTKAEFNALVTLHGGTMVFLVAMPALAAFGNYLIPPMVGADEMAYPRANGLSYWLIAVGGVLVWAPAITNLAGMTGLPFNGGWTTYAPLSSTFDSIGADLWLLGIVMVGLSSTAGSVNFVVTVVNERDAEMGLLDIPVFVWSMVFEAVLAIVGLAPLMLAFVLTLAERNFGVVVFDGTAGGSTLLYQHLFWFFGHPEVYIVLLPWLGAIGEIIPRFAGRPLWGYRAYVGGMAYISLLSAIVWAHHMFTTGLGGMQVGFMITTLSIVIGFAALIFVWVATLWGGRIRLKTPMLFAIGTILMLLFSGLDGIMLGDPVLDQLLHETYWVVSHFHFTLFGGAIMGFFAALYYWFPHFSGRLYSERLGQLHFVLTAVSAPVTFVLLAQLGESGMMRRYAAYTFDPSLMPLHQLTTLVAVVLGLAQVVLVVNLLWSLRYGERATDPWPEELHAMPSPEWSGMPYKPPTPANVALHTDGGRTDSARPADHGRYEGDPR